MLSRTIQLASLVAVGALSATSVAQSTFTYAGPIPSISDLGGGFNTIITESVTTGYTFGNRYNVISATLTEVNTGTFGSEARIAITNDAYPGQSAVVQIFTTSGFTGSLTASPQTNRSYLSNSLNGAAIASGSTFSLEFFESFDDGFDDLVDAEWTNLSFATVASVPPAVTYTTSGTFSISGRPRDASNSVLSLGSVTSSFVLGSDVNILGGTLTQVSTLAASDARARLRCSAYPYLSTSFLLTTGIYFSGTVALGGTISLQSAPVTGIGVPAAIFTGNLVGLTIPSGSTLSLEFYSVADSTAGEEHQVQDFSFALFPGAPLGGPAAPPTATDLGVISEAVASPTTPLVTAVDPLSAAEIKWYSFSIPANIQPTGDKFLDIWTTNAYDTELALYDANGMLLSADDDGGQGLGSLLTIGTHQDPRTPPWTVTTFDLGLNGLTLEGMPAGMYYLAVSRFNSVPDNGFLISSTAFSTTLSVNLVIQTNLSASGTTLTGNALLESIAVDTMSVRPLTIELFDSGGNLVGSPITTSVANSGAFSALLTAPSGTYTVKLSTQGSLRSAITSVTLSGGSVALPSAVTLRNGNVNADSEVGPADFSGVLSQFGNEGAPAFVSADLDRNGEVGPADFSIILARFGAEDE